MNKDEFIKELKLLNIEVDDKKIEMLDKYYELLISWNEKINLTAITLKEEVYLKHFYDSLTLVKTVDFNNINTFCDVGTGAGFPGIVIKIFYPQIKLTLIDALNKRINFLKEVVSTLELDNVELIHVRAEEYAQKNRECFDLVTARAVAPLNILLEYCLPLVRQNKWFVAMKGNNDITSSYNAINILGGQIEKVLEFKLPYENSNRLLIKIQKINETPLKYPRRYDQIKKKPL